MPLPNTAAQVAGLRLQVTGRIRRCTSGTDALIRDRLQHAARRREASGTERIADEFDVGSQDVRIVGSARLGFSPSFHKYATPFSETSDVDVVIVSERLFSPGSEQLFSDLRWLGPPHEGPQSALDQGKRIAEVDVREWRVLKRAVRDFAFGNFNPGLLADRDVLKQEIFGKLRATSGLFLALEPQVFVSKIRCRIFRSWTAAEDYYTNTIRELSFAEEPDVDDIVSDVDEDGEPGDAEQKSA